MALQLDSERDADATMITQPPTPITVRANNSIKLRRRVVFHASAGIVGLSVASVLIAPKAIALSAGHLDVLGIGAAANLALVFGSLMFLREAIRGRAATRTRPDDERR